MTPPIRILPALLLAFAAAVACAGPAPAPTASPALVAWTGRWCAAVDGLRHDQVASATLAERAFDPVPEFPAAVFLAAGFAVDVATGDVRTRADDLDALRSGGGSGLPAVDAWVGGYASAARSVVGRLQSIKDATTLKGPLLPEVTARVVDDARETDRIVQSIRAPGPEVSQLLSAEPSLAAAVAVAPPCADDGTGAPLDGVVPESPLPPAVDGAQVEACGDGACQIVAGPRTVVRIADAELAVVQHDGRSLVIANWAADGSTATSATEFTSEAPSGDVLGDSATRPITVTLDASSRDRAVLDFARH